MRAVSILIAEFFVAGGLHDFYAGPVGVQFIGNDAGQSSSAAAAHFREVRNGVNGAIGIDRQIDAWRERTFQRDVRDSVGSAYSAAGGGNFSWQISRCEYERACTHHGAQNVAPAASS